MEVKNAKVLDNGRKILVGLKRKREDTRERCNTANTASHELILPMKKAIFMEADSDAKFDVGSSIGCTNNYSGKAMANNYSDFLKSGLPQRLMYDQNGEWIDVTKELKDLVREGFERKKAITEVVFQGNHFIFDFVRKVRVDLVSGSQQSIAWIDESGTCFFPELRIDFEFCTCRVKDQAQVNTELNGTCEIEVKLEISVDAKGKLNVLECGEAPVVCAEQLQRKSNIDYNSSNKINAATNEANRGPETYAVPSCGIPDFGLTGLFSSREDYQVVQKMFLAGLGRFIDADSIFGIYRAPMANDLMENRKKLFHKQEEITRSLRGSANVRYGWIVASAKDVKGIMLYGLGHSKRLSLKPLYGVGVHLTAAYHSHISASQSDVDENGLCHMVLCRIIMGNMEKIALESEQFQPSSDTFDSGVDDPVKPRHFTVWNMNVNSHVLPEYVVSFRMPPSIREMLVGSTTISGESGITNAHRQVQQVGSPTDSVGSCKQVPYVAQQIEKAPVSSGLLRFRQKMPQSPWMPFPMLFGAIASKIPREHMDLIDRHYNEYLRKKISRIDFIKRLRMIIGDKLLKSTIMNLQYKSPSLRRREQPQSGMASQASN